MAKQNIPQNTDREELALKVVLDQQLDNPTDIITWEMTREEKWHLERVHGSIIGLADMMDSDEHADINLVLRLVVYDLNDVMDKIKEVDPEKQQVGIAHDDTEDEHPREGSD